MRRWTLFSRMVGAPGVAEPVVDVERDGPIPRRFERVALSEVREALRPIFEQADTNYAYYNRNREVIEGGRSEPDCSPHRVIGAWPPRL